MKTIIYRRAFALTVLLLLLVKVQAQTTIKGKIKDKTTGETIPGVNIQVKGTLTGTITDVQGDFTLKTDQPLPFVLVLSLTGYQAQEIMVDEKTVFPLDILLEEGAVEADEVVVTASRLEEKVIQSPVAIDKMDLRAIRESANASFFDAIENIKGVQMTTLSLGFKVPNTRGFTNTTNARFLQMVDGADSQAPGLGVSIANTVGPTELDVLSVEITPGASSSLYGMNALNGMANVITKNPFYHKGLSVYQKTGLNHVNDPQHMASFFTESSVRYANTIGKKWAYKFNVGYLKGTDWVAANGRDINPLINASTGLTGENNPAIDPINVYGNESSNRKTLSLADGKKYEVRRTGYWEKDLVNNDYNVDNLKADVGIYFRPTEKTEINYTYRIGKTDAIYQRGNRIRLDDYYIQQHKLEAKGTHWMIRSYFTAEYTKKSYNLRPLGENIDKSFKSNTQWFTDYKNAFNHYYAEGYTSADAHALARQQADAGRYQPGTQAYNDQLNELIAINNWDRGAQLYLDNKFFHNEAQYDFSGKIKWIQLLVGADYRTFMIEPEGNSFINPDREHPDRTMYYDKTGAFAQVSRKFINNKLKLIGSVRVDKNKYFDPKVNPRFAAVYELNSNNYIRASYQNGFRFPTLFEGFSTVNNGGVIRYGGLKVISSHLQLFENSYVRKSVDDFQAAVLKDINAGVPQNEAILKHAGILEKNTYTYLQPEEINAFDLGYKAVLINKKLYVEADAYYNIYRNFIDQVEIAVPNAGKIGELQDGVDSTVFAMNDNARQTRYRMWTNSKSVYFNYGGSVSLSYNFYKTYFINTNVGYNVLRKINAVDKYLETPFNTPPYIVNISISNRQLFERIGFTVSWRWQDSFLWRSPLADGQIPAYSTIDAQVSISLPKAYSVIKIGGTNLLNHYYTQYEGGPSVGAFYYIAWTLEGLLTSGKKQ